MEHTKGGPCKKGKNKRKKRRKKRSLDEVRATRNAEHRRETPHVGAVWSGERNRKRRIHVNRTRLEKKLERKPAKTKVVRR